jgi:hypothetical protein
MLVLAVLAGAACGSESRTRETLTATTAARAEVTPAEAGEVTVPTAEPCLFAGTLEPKKANVGAAAMLLTDVRVGAHGCFERVVFELRPRATRPEGPPGYTVEYQPGPITEDPTDKPVPVKGSAFLVVRLDAMGFDLSREDAPATYTGPPAVEVAGTTRVQQVRKAGDFEGVTTWVIGLDSKRPFRVTTEPSPTRLVVDVGDG